MKLISLNCEGHKHLERIIPFIKAENPDVVCLQEIFEVDVLRIKTELNLPFAQFIPQAFVNEVSIHQSVALGNWGILQLSRHENTQFSSYYYEGTADHLPVFFEHNNPNSMNRVVSVAVLELEGKQYTIATTHFTWSTEGVFTELQQTSFKKLSEFLEKYDQLIICGDLNSPRQPGIDNVYARLAQRYNDVIPPEVTTTIDGTYHKAGQLELTVDGLFVSSAYQAHNVRVVDGLSDHCAVVAEINARL